MLVYAVLQGAAARCDEGTTRQGWWLFINTQSYTDHHVFCDSWHDQRSGLDLDFDNGNF